MTDTGLLATLAYCVRPYLENKLYRAVFLDHLAVDEGMLVENFVVQSLRANGH